MENELFEVAEEQVEQTINTSCDHCGTLILISIHDDHLCDRCFSKSI